MIGSLLIIVAAQTASAPPATAQDAAETPQRQLTEDDLKALAWRSIGPANMGGRLAAIAMAPGNSKTIVLGYATGGVWKSTNHGTTFGPVFDDQATSSIGALAVCDAPPQWRGWSGQPEAPQEPEKRIEAGRAKIVWVGTGEGNGRNSSSWGHGVYRSTDGGGSFTHLGLAETHDIPALAVDPRDPDVCYIAALGHLWGPNAERGVYKTSDGGATWQAVLQIDDATGACDVILDPATPDTVYAAMYARRRTPWSFMSGGPEGGIYRSRDAGATWQELAGGLPARTGRIGFDVCRGQPNVLYAVIETDDGGLVGDSFANRSRSGGVFRSDDGGDTWKRTSDVNPRAFYFSRIRCDPKDPQRVYLLGWELYVSDDGGTTFYSGLARVPHVDFHAMVIDPDDTDHLLIGTDGGLYASWDRGKTWDFHNHMAVGQFYNVAVDDSDPYRVAGGLQDNGTWIGPSESLTRESGDFMGRGGAITNAEWRFVYDGDGFHVAFDPEHADVFYAEWQGGNLGRLNLDSMVHRNLRPQPKEGQARFRFNWNAPFLVSPHDPSVIYLGGNRVFRLSARGDQWEAISPDLSRNDIEKICTVGSEAETHGTVVALAESRLQKGLLWAGTDDGLIHVSGDGGAAWADVTPSDGGGLYVACIEPSSHDASVAYAAIDGHRSDSFTPILLRANDLGARWTSIVGDLPASAPVDVVREDPRNPQVLYAGTERACYVTIDGGEHWVKLNGKSLPTVRVDDLVIQRREMDLVAGTHGRSIYILDDISALSALTPEILARELHVFAPLPGRPRQFGPDGGLWGDRMFVAPNPAPGTFITYWLREHATDDVEIVIADTAGRTLRKLSGTGRAGINRVAWDLQAEEKQRIGNAHGMSEHLPPGDYQVTVTCGKKSGKATVSVLEGPS